MLKEPMKRRYKYILDVANEAKKGGLSLSKPGLDRRVGRW